MVPDQFKHVCTVRADLSKVKATAYIGALGPFYAKSFEIVFTCGTELRAQIRWQHNVSTVSTSNKDAVKTTRSRTRLWGSSGEREEVSALYVVVCP